MFVSGFGALFLSCACLSVSGGVVLCRCMCVCDLLIFLQGAGGGYNAPGAGGGYGSGLGYAAGGGYGSQGGRDNGASGFSQVYICIYMCVRIGLTPPPEPEFICIYIYVCM